MASRIGPSEREGLRRAVVCRFIGLRITGKLQTECALGGGLSWRRPNS